MLVMVTILGAGNVGDGSNCNVITLTMIMKVKMIYMMMDVDEY